MYLIGGEIESLPRVQNDKSEQAGLAERKAIGRALKKRNRSNSPGPLNGLDRARLSFFT